MPAATASDAQREPGLGGSVDGDAAIGAGERSEAAGALGQTVGVCRVPPVGNNDGDVERPQPPQGDDEQMDVEAVATQASGAPGSPAGPEHEVAQPSAPSVTGLDGEHLSSSALDDAGSGFLQDDYGADTARIGLEVVPIRQVTSICAPHVPLGYVLTSRRRHATAPVAYSY